MEEGPAGRESFGEVLAKNIKAKIGITAACEVVAVGGLKRSEKKTKRVYDLRENH